jgi:hypothetical protein
MYKINWHYKDSEQTQFSHCSVTPITIVSEGILPGCTAASPRNYFETEAQAWGCVRKGLAATADDSEAYIADLKAEVLAIRAFLDTLPAQEDKP